MDDQNKNLLLATGLSFLVLIGWMLLFPPEAPDQSQVNNSDLSQEVNNPEVPQTSSVINTEAVSYTHLTLPTILLV